jgi:hypothetical protein
MNYLDAEYVTSKWELTFSYTTTRTEKNVVVVGELNRVTSGITRCTNFSDPLSTGGVIYLRRHSVLPTAIVLFPWTSRQTNGIYATQNKRIYT